MESQNINKEESDSGRLDSFNKEDSSKCVRVQNVDGWFLRLQMALSVARDSGEDDSDGSVMSFSSMSSERPRKRKGQSSG